VGFTFYLIAADTSIEAALEPVQLIKGICNGGGKLRSRFAI
jgi:hypothetical protein